VFSTICCRRRTKRWRPSARALAGAGLSCQRTVDRKPSSYLQYTESAIPEGEFLAAVVRASGCGLLLDVNNIYVSSQNHGFDAQRYLQALPAAAVREIHLAGYTVNRYPEGEMLIDSHNALVSQPVWELYAHALRHRRARRYRVTAIAAARHPARAGRTGRRHTGARDRSCCVTCKPSLPPRFLTSGRK
jgi:hypothetical protein